MADFVEAYDTNTGIKVGFVPGHWVEDGSPFPNLSLTPKARKGTEPLPQDTDAAAFAPAIGSSGGPAAPGSTDSGNTTVSEEN